MAFKLPNSMVVELLVRYTDLEDPKADDEYVELKIPRDRKVKLPAFREGRTIAGVYYKTGTWSGGAYALVEAEALTVTKCKPSCTAKHKDHFISITVPTHAGADKTKKVVIFG